MKIKMCKKWNLNQWKKGISTKKKLQFRFIQAIERKTYVKTSEKQKTYKLLTN